MWIIWVSRPPNATLISIEEHNLKSISELSRNEFIELIAEIISAEGGERHQDELLEQFIELSEHPSGSDLIYYPEPGEQATPEAIADKVQEWRKTNGKPGFRED
ncbi:TPA: bacteriocin immunity protein [Enterobacter cloacae subsp. cloacae]|nr:bacteriocin immunity protein [Enterobacter cloacae subsp. cloacae]